ncbi:alpha/beta fold hydrolase [Sphingomonas crocodyli]|uniref:Alpha/beta fold hydrolase n=1 Tax=Sphingomonas crocodyli TaxID=1979270 RepID=A0A437M5F3_9SPHN|nr:alpha/beta fold hydrolase [Sphingomonas crocodyli]RVT92960.1 alpha/beta fold hydrolase [Sphingomonas crocodyli]
MADHSLRGATARAWGVGLTIVVGLVTPLTSGFSQSLDAIVRPKSSLVLEDVGSFIVGGQTITDARGKLIVVNQMYVEYMRPRGSAKSVPVVMVHGGGFTGKIYQTKPDGGMGWEEYFARRGFAVFVADQVGRGRSAPDLSAIEQVRTRNLLPSALPNIRRTSVDDAWTTFRLGPRPGVPYADTQFPIGAIEAFSRQITPSVGKPQQPENYSVLARLAADLRGAVLIGHSESGQYPIEAALLDAAGIRGAVMIEPSCKRVSFEDKSLISYSDGEIARLTKVPLLIVFGDHLDMPWMFGASWRNAFDDCVALAGRVNAAGGSAHILYPPDKSVRGNSHMLMVDRNSDQIADWIIDWIRQYVPAEPSKKKRPH